MIIIVNVVERMARSLIFTKLIWGLCSLCSKEKSKLDWNDFKKNEGIEEDLAVFNRGKHGLVPTHQLQYLLDDKTGACFLQCYNC